MAHIITKVLRKGIQIPNLDENGLNAYSLELQKVLAHGNVRLLLPNIVGGDDILIVEQPVFVPASSTYAVVMWVNWSKYNADFTEESWSMFEGETPEETIAKITDFRGRCKPVISDLITKVFYPNLVGMKFGFNVWFNNWVFIPSC